MLRRLTFLLLLIAAPVHAADAPRVVVSIKPLHSLVAGVMEGVATPALLVEGSASPHTFALRPSQARALRQADILFYMGDTFEVFLQRTLAALPPRVQAVAMEKQPGMTLYPLREGGIWAPHDHGHEAHEEHEGPDLHAWLDVHNAKAIVRAAAQALDARDPAHKAQYDANAARLLQKLDDLDSGMKSRMAPLREKPYIVFHDAYQYFERAYGLTSGGSILVQPDTPPGPQHLAGIREKIRAGQALCLFREPQFDPRVADSIARESAVREGVLDPEGANVPDGPQLYFTVMDNVAKGFEACLGGAP
jgi:zinc transport system substrate-binding protein